VKTTTAAARRLLRESNPVPGDAFPGAAREPDGQGVLDAILASPAETGTRLTPAETHGNFFGGGGKPPAPGVRHICEAR
jgi:hypothetical protein